MVRLPARASATTATRATSASSPRARRRSAGSSSAWSRRLAVAVSATTRPQRPGEQDGIHYWFLDRAEFDRRIDEGEFLEWVDFVGNRYGTLNSEIERLRRLGKAPLLELEPSPKLPGGLAPDATAASGDVRVAGDPLEVPA